MSNIDESEFDSALATQNVKKNLSTSLFLTYSFHAIVTAAVPVYLYYSIFKMSGEEYIPIYSVVTLICAALLGISFHNIYRNIDYRLSSDRSDIISSGLISGPKEEKKKLLEEYKKKSQTVTSNESLSFSVIYNSLFFYALFVLFGFLSFKSFAGIYNYPISTILSASVVMIFFTQILRYKNS